MEYPITATIYVGTVFGEKSIDLSFNSGLTIMVGPNASGKTQTLKILRSYFYNLYFNKVRYLSANRIGLLEQYRSYVNQWGMQNEQSLSLGDLQAKQNRLYIETAVGDFFTMDEKKDVYIKVSERLSVLFNREISIRWDNGQLKAYFLKNGGNEYSIAGEASGLINIASLLAALYDDDIKVLLIDEPEVSLHPQLQAFLLTEIKRVAGDFDEKGKKMIVMATHSTEMIEINSLNALTNYIFFQENGIPKQVQPTAEELNSRLLQELIPRLGQMHKTAFYSSQPLLVEGISDLIICKNIDSLLNMNLGVAGTQIIPVDGKGQFAAVVKLMRLIGKEPVVLTDLDSFLDDNEIVKLFLQKDEAKEAAIEHGHPDLTEFVRNIKTDISKLCIKNKDILFEKYNNNPYWVNKENDVEIEKVLKRSIISTLFSISDDEIDTWNNKVDWKSLKKRMIVLFDTLEKAGCFILRKGAIESYYIFTHKDNNIGKPNAAIEEINNFKLDEKEKVINAYNDIYRALRYSAKVKELNEAKAIKLELLSELAPIMYLLNEDTNINDIKASIRRSRNTSNTLFEYEICNEYEVPAVIIKLKSDIINVEGFPFVVKKNEHVDDIIERTIKPVKNDI